MNEFQQPVIKAYLDPLTPALTEQQQQGIMLSKIINIYSIQKISQPLFTMARLCKKLKLEF